MDYSDTYATVCGLYFSSHYEGRLHEECCEECRKAYSPIYDEDYLMELERDRAVGSYRESSQSTNRFGHGG